jgi:hypothetical protein
VDIGKGKGDDMKVHNMTSKSSGREVANQFEVWDDNGNFYFQSYRTIIVKIDKKGQVLLDADKWDCSITTGRYRNQFLGESKKETEAKLFTGEYKLANLNG